MTITYPRLRIALMTFTLGLAGVWMGDVLTIVDRDINVDLPTASTDVLYTFPAGRTPLILNPGDCHRYVLEKEALEYERRVVRKHLAASRKR